MKRSDSGTFLAQGTRLRASMLLKHRQSFVEITVMKKTSEEPFHISSRSGAFG
jgi:hypothetical protein